MNMNFNANESEFSDGHDHERFFCSVGHNTCILRAPRWSSSAGYIRLDDPERLHRRRTMMIINKKRGDLRQKSSLYHSCNPIHFNNWHGIDKRFCIAAKYSVIILVRNKYNDEFYLHLTVKLNYELKNVSQLIIIIVKVNC
jgi:hypothetical protein